jgi:acyl-ACP thioesterase
MGLIHTPRTIYSIVNGLFKRQLLLRAQPPTSSAGIQPRNTITTGISEMNPHVYQARLGLLDIDYLGHMNNGTYV